ncbi:MAG: DUF2071 domain-containing protein [Planctomycetales bacterium]
MTATATDREIVVHRPWPVPAAPWAVAMNWHDLLFLHWPVRPETLRPLVPSALAIDTFDSWAWIGVIPFRMTGVRHRLLPAIRPFSAFPEINVRTYVTSPGRSGVWFLSLDATSWLSVRVARSWYGLPYHDARIRLEREGHSIHYRSERRARNGRAAPMARFDATYTPTGDPFRAERGTLEHWLVERYCLYSADRRGRVFIGDVDHAPWPLQPAEAEVRVNTMTAPLGIGLPRMAPVCHFARRLDAVAWSVRPVDAADPSARAAAGW